MCTISSLHGNHGILRARVLFAVMAVAGLMLFWGMEARAEWDHDRSVVRNGIYTMGAYTDNYSRNVDADGDGYAEDFSFELHMNAMALVSQAVNVRMIARCLETNNVWPTANSSAIDATTLDTSTFFITLDQTDFAGRLGRDMNLHFSVEMWDDTLTHQLAAVPEAFSLVPIKVDVVTSADLIGLVNSMQEWEWDLNDQLYTATGYTTNYTKGNDVDNNGFPETYTFDVVASGFGAQLVRNNVRAMVYCLNTGQSWVSPNTIRIADGLITSATFRLTEADFAGKIKGPETLRFGSALLSSDASSTTLAFNDKLFEIVPIRVDFVPPQTPNLSNLSSLHGAGNCGPRRAWIDDDTPADDDGIEYYLPQEEDDGKVMHVRRLK